MQPELRQALVLRDIDGLGYDEIALIMLTPIGTVRSRIHRARDAIAIKVEGNASMASDSGRKSHGRNRFQGH